MNFLSDFGVEPILLAAQAVNFLVLLFILNRFLYKPVMKTLEERKSKVAQSLKDAEAIEKRLAKTEEDREKALNEASNEAKKIIMEATESGNQIIDEAQKKAQQKIAVMLAKSEAQISLERDQMNQEIKVELANLVAEGLKVIAGKVLTDKDKKELLEKSLKQIN